MDCGNKNATVYTNQRILHHLPANELIDNGAKIDNSVIIKPSFIAKGAKISNSVIGPYASIGENVSITNSIIKNSIVNNEAVLEATNIENSMIGQFAKIESKSLELSVSDYSEFKN